LSTSKEDPSTSSGQAKLVEKVNGYTRIHLPDERPALTHKFSVGGYEGYMTIGLYPETKQPGELFLVAAKEGSTVSGLLDTIATLVSMCLQSGVPLKTLVRKFKDMSFVPAGFTNTVDIPTAKSITDYVFRYLGKRFLNDADRDELFGPNSGPQAEEHAHAHEHTHVADPLRRIYSEASAPVCQCGALMFKAGSCYSCPNCFATTGVCN
jgi:ribonucleoside-diphosphate reductase alpha chain